MSDGMIEQNIVDLATKKLKDLDSMIKNPHEGIETGDIHSLFSELSGLLQLRETNKHGLSENAVKVLNQIDKRSLYLMSKNKNNRNIS